MAESSRVIDPGDLIRNARMIIDAGTDADLTTLIGVQVLLAHEVQRYGCVTVGAFRKKRVPGGTISMRLVRVVLSALYREQADGTWVENVSNGGHIAGSGIVSNGGHIVPSEPPRARDEVYKYINTNFSGYGSESEVLSETYSESQVTYRLVYPVEGMGCGEGGLDEIRRRTPEPRSVTRMGGMRKNQPKSVSKSDWASMFKFMEKPEAVEVIDYIMAGNQLPEPPPRKRPKASKLPKDWEPDAPELEIARTLGLTTDEAHAIAKDFKTYWLATGQQKYNWLFTWRNWIKKEAARKHGREALKKSKPTTGGGGEVKTKIL